uniref:CSD domain-containing protein n=1 Tax=Alexandrium andersonii TaxID=327968 RepID=A0A7S2MJD9_9DINO
MSLEQPPRQQWQPQQQETDQIREPEASRRRPEGLAPGRKSGRVTRWLNLKGFGWIQPDDGGPAIFVHFSAIAARAMATNNQNSLRVDDIVEFKTAPDPNNPEKIVAVDVTGAWGGPLQAGYRSGEKVGWHEDGPIREVYVGNLAFRTTWRDLQSHFSQVGEVSWAGVATDGWDEKNNHPFSKGWGTVRFDDAAEARQAIHRLNGSRLHGREIYVKEYVGGQEREDDDYEPILPWT